jgi:hypothetical protein
MNSARGALVALLSLVPAAAVAQKPILHVDPSLKDCSVIFAPELTQSAFQRFVREFGSVSAFKQMSPPTTLGKGGIAIGLDMIYFSVDEGSDAWNDTFAHPDSMHYLGSNKQIPSVKLRVGVTDKLDLGAYYTRNPNANYGWLGVEARYGLLRQSETMPISLMLRGAYTKTLYVADMDMHTATYDVSAGRTFWNRVTAYAGWGNDAVLARETSDAVQLKTEVVAVSRAFAGVAVRLWHVALGVERESGALTRTQVQLAMVW